MSKGNLITSFRVAAVVAAPVLAFLIAWWTFGQVVTSEVGGRLKWCLKIYEDPLTPKAKAEKDEKATASADENVCAPAPASDGSRVARAAVGPDARDAAADADAGKKNASNPGQQSGIGAMPGAGSPRSEANAAAVALKVSKARETAAEAAEHLEDARRQLAAAQQFRDSWGGAAPDKTADRTQRRIDEAGDLIKTSNSEVGKADGLLSAAQPGDDGKVDTKTIQNAESARLFSERALTSAKAASEAAETMNSDIRAAKRKLDENVAAKETRERQFSASDYKARLDFTFASFAMRVAAALAIATALLQLSPARSNSAGWIVVCIVATLVVGFAAHRFGPGDLGGAGVIRNLLETAQTRGIATSDLVDVASGAIAWNAVLGFAAIAALLVLLARIAAYDPTTTDEAEKSGRLTQLQLVMLLGMLLFVTASAVDKSLVALASLYLDDAVGPGTKLALDQLPVFWGAAGSACLAAALGAAYMAISSDKPQPPETGRMLAIRRTDDSDFKAFGWIVQLLVALIPLFKAAYDAYGALPDIPG